MKTVLEKPSLIPRSLAVWLVAACLGTLVPAAAQGSRLADSQGSAPSGPKESSSAVQQVQSGRSSPGSPAAKESGKAPAGREAPSPAGGGEIRGQVLGEGDKPIERSVVLVLADEPAPGPSLRSTAGRADPPVPQATAARVETGADGSFVVRRLSGPTFTLRFSARGYAPLTQQQVRAGATVKVTLKRGFTVPGVVREIAGRRPIAGATVLAWDPDAERFGEEACLRAATGKDGRFVLENLPQATLALEARAAGHAPAKIGGVVVPRPRAADGASAPDLELLLGQGGRIAGRVLGRDGKLLGGASVRARLFGVDAGTPMPAGGAQSTTSGPSGAFEFDALPQGRYQVTVEKKGSGTASGGPYEIRAGTNLTNVEIRLEGGAGLKVRLLDRRKKPVSGLSAELLNEAAKPGTGTRRPESRPVPREKISEGGEGRFTIGGLRPGIYTVRLRGDWGDVKREHVKIQDGGATDLGTIVVGEARVISGLVTDSSGAPIAGADVAAAWYEGAKIVTRHGRTGGDGRYRITDLGSATVDLMLVKASGFAQSTRDGDAPPDGVVDFVVLHGGSIAGQVETTGGGSDSFRVKIRPEEGSAKDAAGGAGRERMFSGSFRLDDIDPGRYTVEISAGRYAPIVMTGITVDGEQVTDLGTLRLDTSGASGAPEGAGAPGRMSAPGDPGYGENGSGYGSGDGTTGGSGTSGSPARLRGLVLAARDGSPVSGATIRVQLQYAVPGGDPSSAPGGVGSTGGDGSFVIAGLQAGSYVVTIEHPSFSSATGRADLQPGQESGGFVVRLYRGGSLMGLVVDQQRQPVSNAAILVYRATGELAQSAATGGDGRYLLERLTPGSYLVARQGAAGGTGEGPGAKPALIQEGETTVVNFDEAPTVTMTGRVLKGDVPLPTVSIAMVAIGGTGTNNIRSTQSDAQGGYTIGLDHGGVYQVTVGMGGTGGTAGVSTVNLMVPDQSQVQMDIVFAIKAITGHIRARDGNPIKAAVVTVVRNTTGPGDPPRQSIVNSGQDGAYKVEGIDAGTYRVTARATGFQSAEFYPLTVSEETPAPTIDLTLDPQWILKGRVVDQQDRGIAGALVVAAPPGVAEGGFLPSNTDGTGAFRITASAESSVNVTAIPTGFAPAVLLDVRPSDENGPDVLIRVDNGGTVRIRVVGPDGQPVAGVQTAMRPDPLFPGCDYVMDHNRPRPTDADGISVVTLLTPGEWMISVVGRGGVAPVRATVIDGNETEVQVNLP